MHSVQVLMSTYNGERYIRQQVESIINQKDVTVHILIRDDGSTDNTPSILKELANRHSNISIILEKNVGVVKSFFALFNNADLSFDYYALSDQDDFWDDDKLSIATNKLSKSSIPALYCCESIITDSKLMYDEFNNEQINASNKEFTKVPSFNNALIENIARGGSIVFNQKLLNLVAIEPSDNIYMHDWWLYLTASCFGEVIYDSQPHYKYRQHSGNVLGAASNNALSKFKRRIKQSKKNKCHMSAQAKAFAKTYDIPQQYKKPITIMCNYTRSTKLRFAGLSGKYLYRQSKFDNLIFRLLFFTNHL